MPLPKIEAGIQRQRPSSKTLFGSSATNGPVGSGPLSITFPCTRVDSWARLQRQRPFFVVAPVAIVGAIFGGAGIAVGMVVPIAAFGVVYTPFDWMASAMETTEELKRAKAWCQTLKNMEGGDSLTRDLFACDDALQLLRLSCEELESSTTPAQTASTPKSTSQ